MPRVLPRVCWLFLAASSAALAGTFQIGAQTFTLPDGFEVERVAGPPLVERPVSASFDELGRLYVTEASGSNDKLTRQLIDRPHRVLRLEEADADGHFTKRTVFADKLMLPEGVLWRDGALYVGAPPSIWKLTDTDGDGVADQRVEWYQGRTLTGCGNDIHGPYSGPDGWLYWCKGAFAEQTHERPGRPTIHDRASHLFRCRADGSDFESVMSGGMDNPVGLAFTPEGEPIFSATFLDLSGDGKRDGLGHAIYGGVFGKVNAVVDDPALSRTGALLQVMTHFGAGAPCGLTRMKAGVFGESYRNSLFACLFNLHKVTRHVLVEKGASYQTRDEDFVVSDNHDFHPTDVLEDADGSLLIVDTGGWYKLCCPTSQLAKPDVLGAIYRVRRTGAPRLEDPRGRQIAWGRLDAPALAALLAEARPCVVAQATAALVKIGAPAVPALESALPGATPPVRQSILWTLAQIPSARARTAVRSALADADAAVRQTAAKVAGLTRDLEARPALERLLEDSSLHVRSVAAEGLGRLGQAQAIPALLAAVTAAPDDRFLEHALINALIELGVRDALTAQVMQAVEGKSQLSVPARRAVVVALSEMPGGLPELALLFLESPEPLLRDTAKWVFSRHPKLASTDAEFLRGYLQKASPGDAEAMLVIMLRDPAAQPFATALLREGDRAGRESVLRAIRQAEVKTMPPEWLEQLERLLRTEPASLACTVPAANLAVATKEGARLIAPLLEVAHSAAAPELRLEALSALPAGAWAADEAAFAQLRAQFTENATPESRATAAGVLARATLNDEQRVRLTELFPKLGLLELTRLLPAFNRTLPEPLAAQFLTALENAPALASCPPQVLRELFAKLPEPVQPRGQALLARLHLDTVQQRAKLDAIAAELPAGDLRRGQLLFNSTKAACTVCHAIGYLGGHFGPDLTSIGSVRNERDLLEAIVLPSASFVRSFEPMTVRLKSGAEMVGLLRSETSEAVVLASAPGAEQRLARADVEAITPGTVSLMPQGFDQIFTRQELSDLIAFLQASQRKPH